MQSKGIHAELAELAGCHQAVDDVLADAGRLDVVISNAAAWTEEPFLEMKDESWHKVIAVNLTAYFRVGQRAAHAMVEAGNGGVILFTASISSLGASPAFAHYSAAKAGVANLVTDHGDRARRPTGSGSTPSAPAPPTPSSRSTSSARS